MNRKQIVFGIVGTVVGFILGFFVAQATMDPHVPPTSQEAGGLPENHPSPEVMENLNRMLQQAESDPNDRQVRVAIGNIYYDMGRFDAAIPYYETALEMNPSDVSVSTDLGTAYLYTGKVDQAMAQYEKSLTLEKDHAQTLQNLGIAYFSAGEYQRAIDTWERLIEVHPDYPHAEELKKQIEAARMHLNSEASQ